MAKRKERSFKSKVSGVRAPKKKKSRSGYSTVARTRGAYSKGEMKYFDSLRTVSTITPSNNWTGTEYDPNVVPVANMNTLFAPTQGAGIDQRIGKAAKIHKIKIHGTLTGPAQADQVAPDDAAIVRIALVQDMQTNSTQAQGEQIFTPPATATFPLALDSFQNIDNFGRFKVLKDKYFVMNPTSPAWDGTNLEQAGSCRKFKWTINFKEPVEVRFNATNGGTVADVVDNSFHIIANASNATMGIVLSYVCRVCFKG